MKKIILSLFAALLISTGAFAQKNVYLTIKHMLGTSPFAFNQATTNNLNNPLSITRVDYYMSGFTIIHDGGMQTPVSPNLVLFVQGNSNFVADLGNYNVTNVEGITFSIGVPANLNGLDPAQYAATHPLAPKSPSMHWSWSTGYRFVCLEGKAGASLGTTYQMHGIFIANYFQQTKMLAGVNVGNNVLVNLDADYTKAVQGIDVTLGPVDHGVGATDLTVLQNFRDFVFSPGTGFPLSVSKLDQNISLDIFPNPSHGSVSVRWDNKGMAAITSAEIIDVTGKQVKEIYLNNGAKEFNLDLSVKGFYVVRLKSFGAQVVSKKIVIQ